MIVDSNLMSLIKKYSIIDESCYDISCLKLTLDKKIKRYIIPENKVINYESTNMDEFTKPLNITKSKGYTLNPHECILACSSEVIKMPTFCFGLLQTKGSLARLFVFLNCADGQVDPGYNGKITFEIYNASNFKVKISPGQEVGNLYIFKTSTDSKGYNGRYQNAKFPTCSKIR